MKYPNLQVFKESRRTRMFYVYVLRCRDGSLYTGYTSNVATRLKKHSEGTASRYTRGRLPVTLVAQWHFPTKEEAMKAEFAFKHLPRKEKTERIKNRPVP